MYVSIKYNNRHILLGQNNDNNNNNTKTPFFLTSAFY